MLRAQYSGGMGRNGISAQSREVRMKRLADRIDALLEKDERRLRRGREVADMRRSAASEIHRICDEFVRSLNGMLERSAIELDPSEFDPSTFHEDNPNLMQI